MAQVQRWVVTGSSRGIGLAIARLAAQRGHRVAVLARGEGVVNVAQELGELTLPIRVNICDADATKAAIDGIAQRWNGIDVVVNNAGLHRGGLLQSLPIEHWDEVLKTNLFGPFHVVRAALPHMSEGASIVNIGAVIGLRGFAGDVPYAASKAGLIGFNQALAIEMARRGIRVNLVIPGVIATDMTANISERAYRRLVARIPLGREGKDVEIAEVVHWVAGSTYMTGAIVPTDGGLLAQL
jgi:NAD(P)-dependent dehydrogenase (short-subunit alcohol dehydrogenase family)